MELKTVTLEGVTYAVVQDGKPVYVDAGKEIAFDAPGTRATITRLNGEAQGHRERAEKAEGSLKGFEGITDPGAALKALETVSNLDNKKLIDAGEAQRVRDEIAKTYEGKLAEADKKYGDLEGQYHGEKLKAAFAGSKFITEKVAVPPDMLQATFGGHFKIIDGKVVGHDTAGRPLINAGNPAEPPSFDDAIKALIDVYPYKDHILKGSGGSGSGAPPGGGGGGDGKTISRAEFTKLAPDQQMAKAREGVVVTE
jgi:hypothetical protein